MLYGLDFMELCHQGAIYKVPKENGGMKFQVNPSLCTGCGDCYTGLNCHNNVGWNTTVRMVSYIDPPQQLTITACPPHVVAYPWEIPMCLLPITQSLPCIEPVLFPCERSIAWHRDRRVIGTCRPSIGDVCPTILPRDPGDMRALLQKRWRVKDLDRYMRMTPKATLDKKISALPKNWQKPVRHLLKVIRKG